MIFRRLVMDNFGPYRGRHGVDLGVTEQAPVIVIHGENERGKTTLANALRWCLYKRALESDGTKVDTFQLMNWESLDAGDYHMAVSLAFEHAGVEYELERHVQASLRPTSDTDL